MVDFTLPEKLSEEFLNLIPYQRAMVNRLFREGKLVNYAFSLEKSKLWAVLSANSELEVMSILSDLPLSPYMTEAKVSLLTFYNTADVTMPQFSMN